MPVPHEDANRRLPRIDKWTQEHPRQLKQVLEKIKAQWDIGMSHKTLTRILKGLQMSWHRFRRVVDNQHGVEV